MAKRTQRKSPHSHRKEAELHSRRKDAELLSHRKETKFLYLESRTDTLLTIKKYINLLKGSYLIEESSSPSGMVSYRIEASENMPSPAGKKRSFATNPGVYGTSDLWYWRKEQQFPYLFTVWRKVK